jgi:LPS export ABC transporter protein LptC
VLLIRALLQAPMPVRRGGNPAPPPAVLPTSAPTARPTAARIPPVQVEHTAISTVDAQGRRQWDLRAEAVSVDGAAGTATLTNIEGTYFEAGQPSVRLRAASGSFTLATRNVTLTGGVHAESTTGRMLDAEIVKWFPRAQRIEAVGSVVLRQPGMIVHADHLTADITLQRTRLSGNIRVTVNE